MYSNLFNFSKLNFIFRERRQINEALLEASRYGLADVCKILFSVGADVNYAKCVETPLYLGCAYAYTCVETPLYLACAYAHPACVDLLIAHGSYLNPTSYDNDTPLVATSMAAYININDDQMIDARCRCMHLLLDAGANIDETDDNGETALSGAVWNFRLTEILINAGANVNFLDYDMDSILHHACILRLHSNVVELLLEHGANIDAVNADGITPLAYACSHYNLTVVDVLIRHNCDIDIVDSDGYTALRHVSTNAFDSKTEAALKLDVKHLMVICVQTRLQASSSDWIRLARQPQIVAVPTRRLRIRRQI